MHKKNDNWICPYLLEKQGGKCTFYKMSYIIEFVLASLSTVLLAVQLDVCLYLLGMWAHWSLHLQHWDKANNKFSVELFVSLNLLDSWRQREILDCFYLWNKMKFIWRGNMLDSPSPKTWRTIYHHGQIETGTHVGQAEACDCDGQSESNKQSYFLHSDLIISLESDHIHYVYWTVKKAGNL